MLILHFILGLVSLLKNNNNKNLSVGVRKIVVQVRGSKNDYPAHRRFQVAMTHPICNSSTQEAMIGDPLSKVAS